MHHISYPSSLDNEIMTTKNKLSRYRSEIQNEIYPTRLAIRAPVPHALFEYSKTYPARGAPSPLQLVYTKQKTAQKEENRREKRERKRKKEKEKEKEKKKKKRKRKRKRKRILEKEKEKRKKILNLPRYAFGKTKAQTFIVNEK